MFFEIRKMTIAATMASMIAYMTAQFCDVQIFHFLKKLTKGKHLWLRNNGSTLVNSVPSRLRKRSHEQERSGEMSVTDV